MHLIAHLRSGWARAWMSGGMPAEVEAALTVPLYIRGASLMIGHVAGIFLCVMAMIRIGGGLAAVLTAASLAVLAARLQMMRLMRPMLAAPTPAGLLSWRYPYQTSGLFWALLCGATCAVCVGWGDDEFTQLLATALALATSAGISSRNAGTPRYALAQIGLWLAPMAVIWPKVGSWGWGMSLMLAIYTTAMASIVRRQHADTLALIGADRQSRVAQKELAEREADLRAIFDHVYAGFADVDFATGRPVRVNSEFCRMTGRDEAACLALPHIATLLYRDDQAEAQRLWSELGETGQPFKCEHRLVRANGSIMQVRFSGSVAAVASNGRPTRAAVIIQDISARKSTEAALRESEEMLRLSLEIGRIGSYRNDLVTGFVHCGAQTRMMHGLPPGDAPVPAQVMREMILAEDAGRVETGIAAAFSANRPSIEQEYRILHPDGGTRHFETRSQIAYRADGSPTSLHGVIIDVTERRAAEQRMAHLAHHDPLTGLANRALLRIRLDEAIARSLRGERCAILCVDLDRFKIVNDTLGHPVGDGLLRAVTARLQAVMRPTDTVARLGSDDFAFVMSCLDDPADAGALAERLIAAVSVPYDIDGHRIIIGTCIGIAIVPDDGVDPDLLLRHADTALYGAKSVGRDGYRFFEAEMDVRLQSRRQLEIDLRFALEQDSFELHYQPLIDVGTRALVGFEALLRWRHPVRGLIMPDRFIPLAESIGLIVPIGDWVLRRACADAANWPGTLRVAVNLSVVQFGDAALVDNVASAMNDAGLDAERLELEITESVMLTDTEATLETLHRLKAIGISIGMDDFGTGYSSLRYLQRFPFDKVKIDRSFIAHLGETRESAAIVGAVIDLCRSLDMRTTAEGVETEEQFAALVHIGCTEAQGYLFSRPRPAGEIKGLIVAMGSAREAASVDSS